MVHIIDIPILRQTFDYDCGAKALQSVLAYFGVETREDSIMKEAHTTHGGTPIDGIVRTAKQYGMECVSRRMDLADLKRFIRKRIPVIIVLQAWTEKMNVDWKNDWRDGHYVVVIGYDDKKQVVIMEDPSSFQRTYLTYAELQERWHDVDIGGKKFIHHGIAIHRKAGKPRKKSLIHLD